MTFIMAELKTGNAPKHRQADPKAPGKTLGRHLREWMDALVIAFALAMFIRTFVAELYKIPTGSMIPTLIGGLIAEWDVNEDGRKDVVAFYPHSNPPVAVFYKEADGGFSPPEALELDPTTQLAIRRHTKEENHLVLVNKFAYLFSLPRRGDIVIFKVPPRIYDRTRPIYIKRCVGLPGEHIAIRDHRLYINGERVDDPPVFQRIYYSQFTQHGVFGEEQIPDDEFYVFGDNSRNSLDSREWGGVKVNNLRGRAVLRPWPVQKFKFL
ncbi:MAG: hypothetical protein Kow0059_18890 [Candidatus Sumerlaeia bacterium]